MSIDENEIDGYGIITKAEFTSNLQKMLKSSNRNTTIYINTHGEITGIE